ncbi:MAG: 2-C-methyl-D-erythritol 4-phosphate cytidylyltransferase [Actinobacteria bacterium]|nr:2-C-methyl-D-erythritol 4-phosphate cytidylyltransferase [Actinomycetota bacterium]MEC7809961.1 2-C-methyl-D-erythritol 4-phosphate cytidylyltransferase [Actinomycetota bacterium]MED5277160.1 2-C-methyl-D-erythritol 4-phosphate cytidylyltransferase [Actinomycetota bacterium]|tara:strand:+ start:13200 stop:13850 length:651 start_codon:yes stop_codon:yes gene_type:complete
MKIWTILVAAGEGLRFGSKKQFAELSGSSVLFHSAIAASSVSDGIVVVTSGEDIEYVKNCLHEVKKVKEVVEGGSTRTKSVRHGLELVPQDSEILIVHDGVRPLASEKLFKSVVNKVQEGSEAVVPVIPVSDSLRSINGSHIDRSEVVAVQTPQAFNATLLRKAYSICENTSDDSSLVELAGGTIDFVEGDARNLKITVNSDLLIAEQFLNSKVID